jgi:protein-L-isoaspartate(D-aspartate) O-methyltransferase
MVDFHRARQVMVDGQIRAGGVFEPRLLGRLGSVPREDFVPPARRDLAYFDDLHWFGAPGASRFMPVLDVGATTGYATAVIAGLAASVTGLDSDSALADTGNAILASLGLANASLVSGGIEQFGKARFDVILVQGMLDTVPPAFLDALKGGGRLVALLRTGPVGVAHVFVKSGGKVTARPEFNASLPPLPGMRRDEEFIF